MNAPAPQAAADELWNCLNRMGRDDGARVERILWQFRGLVARKPCDFDARSGIARALLMLGRKEEAIPHVEALWGMRHGRGFTELLCLGFVFLNYGNILHALAVYDDLLDRPEARCDEILRNHMTELAFRAGDLTHWDRAEQVIGKANPGEQRWRALLSANGLEEAFHHHQAMAEAIIGPHASYFHGNVMTDGDGETIAYLEYFTDLDEDARFELEGAFSERLDSGDLMRVADCVTVCVRGPYANRLEAAA